MTRLVFAPPAPYLSGLGLRTPLTARLLFSSTRPFMSPDSLLMHVHSGLFRLALALLLLLTACRSSKPSSTASKPHKGLMDANTRLKIEQDYVTASAQMMRGEKQAAFELFEQVVSADPDNHAAMYNLARLHLENNDLDAAIGYARNALSRNPENYWYYKTLQQALERKGNYDEAIKVMRQLVTQFPQKYRDQLQLADLLQRSGKNQQAIEVLEKLQLTTGPNPEILLRQYQLHGQNRSWEKALKVSRQLIAIDELEGRFYQMQFEALMNLERSAEAASTLEGLLEKDPDNGFALLSLADYYKSIDSLDRSDEYLFRAFSNPSIEPDGKMQIIERMLAFADRQPALVPRVKRLAAIFAETHPGTAKALAIQGQIMLLEQNMDSARVYFQQSLELAPSDLDVWMALIETSFLSNDYETIFRDAERAMDYYPNQEQFLYFYGLSASQTDRPEAAIYAYEKIKKIGGSNPDLLVQVYAELGRIYHDQGKHKQSDENLQAALDLQPENDLLLNNYAYYLAERNERLDEASEMVQKALKQEPNRPSYLDTYGWILYRQGKYAEALEPLGKAAELSGSAVILGHYADALYRGGQTEAARVYWQKALEAGADFSIQEKLQQ